jgi:molybdopterin molybdotransferase
MVTTFEQALSLVREKLAAARGRPSVESLPLEQVRGRILAEDATADRDYPPFHRSTRDGYAVRAGETVAAPVCLECVGEARAGNPYRGDLRARDLCCVRIMTGAPLPEGTDAVVMMEYTRAQGDRVEVQRPVAAGENVVGKGSEAPAGHVVLPRGRRLGAGEMGLLASVGRAQVCVFRQPAVAVLPTGDEVVPVEQAPEWFQIRNSNSLALAAQVAAAGGVPRPLGIAPDNVEALRRLIQQGLEADLLLLSGGISVGKYDLVAQVLSEMGAELYFHGVAIRPGKPLAFGRVANTFFFGLPGNPVSTFVTFELFVRPAIAWLSGAEFECPVFLRARLGKPVHQKTGLTAFMPARVEWESGDPVVNLVSWQGSGDLVGVAAANCFLAVHPEQTDLAAGDWVDVLPKSM